MVGKYIDIHNKICALPFTHLATHPTGVVTPCCITDMKDGVSIAMSDKGDMMHLSEDAIEDILNSKKFKKVRKEMMEGLEPDVCKNCYLYEKNGVYSKRNEANDKYGKYIEELIKNTDSTGKLTNIDLKYIELRLGNVCNLKCVTCNTFSSSKWNEDIIAFSDTIFKLDYRDSEDKVAWYRDYKFYDELLRYCSNLKEVWINGGEPTLIKEHSYFLKKLIELGYADNIDLHYSLNVTRMPSPFIDIWKEFKKVKIHLSIDDLEERNDYIRYPSKWDTILFNLNKILQYRDLFTLEICQTVSALNIFNIDKFNKFVNSYNINHILNFVHYPSHLHVSVIPEEMKKNIVLRLNKLDPKLKTQIEVELLNTPDKEDIDKFYSFISILDSQRGVYIKDYLEEWKNYF